MSKQVFTDDNTYIVKGVLPLSEGKITLGMVRSNEKYEELVNRHIIHYSKIMLMRVNRISLLHSYIDEIYNTKGYSRRTVIPRIKKTKLPPLIGNLYLKEDDKFFYMQAIYNRKRVILKFDIADKAILDPIVKNRYHFIGRYFKMTKQVYFIKSGKKLRSNSLYRYLFGEKIYTEVIHKDGDIFNYCRNNLLLTGIRHKLKENITTDISTIYCEKKEHELVGFKRCSDRKTSKYVAVLTHNRREIKIGRFNDPYEAAMAYDIAIAYYKGPVFTVNYHFSYYTVLKQDLVSKWFNNFDEREKKRNIRLAQSLHNNEVALSHKENNNEKPV